VATALLFFNFSRFRIPVVPVLILFAGVALVWFGRQFGTTVQAILETGFPAGIRSGAILLLALAGVTGMAVWSLDSQDTTILATVQRQVQLADLLRRTGHHKKALAEFEKARYLLGDAPIEERLDLLGDTPVETFRGILKEEKVAHGLNFRLVHAWVYQGMGFTWREMGELKQAAESMEESIRIFLDGPGLLIILAEVYQELGDLRAAGRHLQRALKLEENFSVRFDLAGILFELGNPNRAYTVLLEAPELNPDMTPGQLADYHFGLALILLKGLNQPQEARRHLQSCLQLAPDHPQAEEIRDNLRHLDTSPGSP
jgi:tetratricopeptide (TPR) repeat protein